MLLPGPTCRGSELSVQEYSLGSSEWAARLRTPKQGINKVLGPTGVWEEKGAWVGVLCLGIKWTNEDSGQSPGLWLFMQAPGTPDRGRRGSLPPRRQLHISQARHQACSQDENASICLRHRLYCESCSLGLHRKQKCDYSAGLAFLTVGGEMPGCLETICCISNLLRFQTGIQIDRMHYSVGNS